MNSENSTLPPSEKDKRYNVGPDLASPLTVCAPVIAAQGLLLFLFNDSERSKRNYVNT